MDLRDDWTQALCDNGFDRTAPTAWIAEGLLIYLPADGQQKLFAGIDALSAPASQVAVEESVPMNAAAFEAAKQQERAAGEDGTFFTLVYNEQHKPAAQWFQEQDWQVFATPLPGLLAALGRPVPPSIPPPVR